MSKKYPSKISYGLLGFIFAVLYAPLLIVVFEEGTTKEWLGAFTFFFTGILICFRSFFQNLLCN